MIAVWMLYCVGIGLAFVVVGHALERVLHFAGRPTRWAWVIAMALDMRGRAQLLTLFFPVSRSDPHLMR